MQQLLQELWDEYRAVVDKISDIVDDQVINEEPYLSLIELTDDTEQMEVLRNKLFNAGIKNIAGKLY